MTKSAKYDKIASGVASGIILPLLVALFVFLFSKGDPGLTEWLRKISLAGVETQIITLCVFPNVLIFFLFNYLDMLRASRGVLGITIVWAVIVFIVKLF
jgi:hypothetical protein